MTVCAKMNTLDPTFLSKSHNDDALVALRQYCFPSFAFREFVSVNLSLQ